MRRQIKKIKKHPTFVSSGNYQVNIMWCEPGIRLELRWILMISQKDISEANMPQFLLVPVPQMRQLVVCLCCTWQQNQYLRILECWNNKQIHEYNFHGFREMLYLTQIFNISSAKENWENKWQIIHQKFQPCIRRMTFKALKLLRKLWENQSRSKDRKISGWNMHERILKLVNVLRNVHQFDVTLGS